MQDEQFYHWVRQIPYGKVASYGQIAKLAGAPRHARHVGRALSMLKHSKQAEKSPVPWHRVVNSQGCISDRGLDGGEAIQRIMLEDEGVEFSLSGRISLKRYQWQVDICAV